MLKAGSQQRCWGVAVGERRALRFTLVAYRATAIARLACVAVGGLVVRNICSSRRSVVEDLVPFTLHQGAQMSDGGRLQSRTTGMTLLLCGPSILMRSGAVLVLWTLDGPSDTTIGGAVSILGTLWGCPGSVSVSVSDGQQWVVHDLLA